MLGLSPRNGTIVHLTSKYGITQYVFKHAARCFTLDEARELKSI
jgi:hypothetical protein